ncbi:MAG: baseplate J protein [Caulobacter sp.]|nr:baseplate J protein [Caulobacter sp.]
MPFTRPTLSALIDQAETDMSGRLAGGDALLRRAIELVLARVHAGAIHGLYGFLDYAAEQLMPDTADAEHLSRWAGIYGVARKAATAATGSADLTGVNTSVIPEGTRLQRSDGAEYLVTAEATIALGVATAAIVAAEAGAGGLAEAGTALTFVSPVAGVSSAAVVAVGGVTGGVDEESDNDLRGRLLARIREQPRGGAATDYERWALEVAGVTRAWVFPERDGLGTVGVTFVLDGLEDVIPASGDLTAVADYIDPLRPVTADVTVFAPTPLALDPEIELTPATDAVKAAVEAELRDLLTRETEPGGTLLISHIREAISIAAGETDHVLVSPAANVVADPEEIVVLGTITWS